MDNTQRSIHRMLSIVSESLEDAVHHNQYPDMAKVILFKESGKYYTQEWWRIPSNAIGPYDMSKSLDFRRIGNGPVLVITQEPWGFPHLIV